MSQRDWWALSPDGVGHLPKLQSPGVLITRCQRSLPPKLGRCGVMHEGLRRCPACPASLLRVVRP